MSAGRIGWAVCAAAVAIWMIASLVSKQTLFVSRGVPPHIVTRRKEPFTYWFTIVVRGFFLVLMIRDVLTWP